MEEPIVRKVKIHDNVDELLASGAKFKEETVTDYRTRLQYLKDNYEVLKSYPGVDRERLKQLNDKIKKLENLVIFYENRSW